LSLAWCSSSLCALACPIRYAFHLLNVRALNLLSYCIQIAEPLCVATCPQVDARPSLRAVGEGRGGRRVGTVVSGAAAAHADGSGHLPKSLAAPMGKRPRSSD
jgi:hypothetical protein